MRPAFVQSGDTIALICTARWLSEDQCNAAVAAFATMGLRLVVGPHAMAQYYQLAGNDDQRRADLEWAFSDSTIKGVIIGRGGYGSVRLLDTLDMDLIRSNPKWLVGFSDVTSLIAHFNSHGISAIHGPMPVQFDGLNPDCLAALFNAIRGHYTALEWSGLAIGDWPQDQSFRLLGGNLSVVCSLLGSPSFEPQEPYFLVIEDIDEMLYHLDRMLFALGRSGAAKQLKGVLVGGMTDFKDNTIADGFKTDNPWGLDAQKIISEWGQRFGFPIITGLPVGHQPANYPLFLGEKAQVKEVDQGIWRLTWPEVLMP
ncbi:MAG: hypothetical protein RLZZ262_193 [Bacteroidota bacterium]|jgi:muramoyltetrapeptide carboxypeptidase